MKGKLSRSFNITNAPLFDPEIWLLENFLDSHSWTWLHRPVLHYSNGKRLKTTTTKNPSIGDSSNPPMYLYTGIPCSNLNPPNMEAVGALTWKGLQDIVRKRASCKALSVQWYLLHWLLWKNYISSFIYFLIKIPREIS